MNELTLHPHVYATGASKGLISILERVWLREQPLEPSTARMCIQSLTHGDATRPLTLGAVIRHLRKSAA
jgi:hypothetical protein